MSVSAITGVSGWLETILSKEQILVTVVLLGVIFTCVWALVDLKHPIRRAAIAIWLAAP